MAATNPAIESGLLGRSWERTVFPKPRTCLLMMSRYQPVSGRLQSHPWDAGTSEIVSCNVLVHAGAMEHATCPIERERSPKAEMKPDHVFHVWFTPLRFAKYWKGTACPGEWVQFTTRQDAMKKGFNPTKTEKHAWTRPKQGLKVSRQSIIVVTCILKTWSLCL